MTMDDASTDEGSSPRMRGALRSSMMYMPSAGIIPAYAGSTAGVRIRAWRSRDHPRVCGEHRDGSGYADTFAGSSPRMRGAPFTNISDELRKGIIPAYAGSTCR